MPPIVNHVPEPIPPRRAADAARGSVPVANPPYPRWWPMRVLLGLVLMPPTAALVGVGIFPLYWWLAAPALGAGRGQASLDAAVSFGLAGGLVAIPVTLIGALPLVTTLVERGVPLTFRRTVLRGIALGNASFLLLDGIAAVIWLSRGPAALRGGLLGEGADLIVRGAALGTVAGAVCAAVFWLVVRDPTTVAARDLT